MTRDSQSPTHIVAPTVKIVVVEDNPADLGLIRELLENDSSNRYELKAFDRLNPVPDYIQNNPVNAILLDLNLPDSRGIETFRKIRAANRHVPILILTGFEDEELAVATLQEGAEDYIFKNNLQESMIDRLIRFSIERFRLKTEILENQQLRELILEASGSGYMILDEQKNIIYANSIARALSGKNKGDLLQEKFPAITREDLQKHHQFVDDSGRLITYELSSTELQWKGSSAYLITLEDLTEQLEIEALEKETETLKKIQQFSGAIAHEFSQPLQILGYTVEFMKMENGDSERLQMLMKNINRITQLVQNLRRIVRMQTIPYLSTEILDLAGSSDLSEALATTIEENDPRFRKKMCDKKLNMQQ